MYDVVKKEKSGNHLIYWCYQDLEESFVNEQIGELFSYLTGGHSTRPETRHLLEKIFKKLYCPLQDEISFQLLTLQIQQSGMKITHWQNLTQVIPSPPPDDKLI
jgi:hypothetical protein